jgi:hypothetical protein
MTTTRRTFMRQVGVTLTGLLVSGCMPGPAPEVVEKVTCYQVVEELAVTVTPASEASERWQALRACWLELADPRLATVDSTPYAEALRGRHRDALAALVAAQALEQDVAGHIGVAFEEAMSHIQRKLATCYVELEIGEANPYPPREEVVTQAAALAEMAERSAIAPETVAAARTTLARDMAWLDQFRAGGNPDEVTALEATPAEIEAARVLAALLSETQ